MKFEHLIYGTFPDLPGSQQVVYKSPDISSDLESWLIQRFDQFGDCKTEDFRSSLTLQWYREAELPVATLTKVSHAGKDFSGRWGALLRHTAIISVDQFRMLNGDISVLAEVLASSGTSEELSQFGDLDISEPADALTQMEVLFAGKIENFSENLGKLLTGERLVLYADLNTPHVNRYLQMLIALTPLRIRERLNWSEFVFHSLPELDLSVVHSSRYSAPEGDLVEFQSDGDNSTGDAKMDPDEASEFVAKLAAAIQNGSAEEYLQILEYIA